MTRKEARTYIQSLGLHYSYDHETREHRVAPNKFAETQANYTDDLEDAIGTAKHMAEWMKANRKAAQ